MSDKWQEGNALTSLSKLQHFLKDHVSEDFLADLAEGLARSPMVIRITPYLASLIDWSEPYTDPIRLQFLPLASQIEENHPLLSYDSLGEQADSPVEGLTHRYGDRVLFLTTDACPVYCRFCTRSYSVGSDTAQVTKINFRYENSKWERVFEYLASHPEIEDVVISGGDAIRLKPSQLSLIGERLIEMPNIRRMRFATKGLSVLPMKILSDHAWTDTLTRICELGRSRHKNISIHTHINHPNEITDITHRAMNRLFERGIIVRNQSVILRGVNDDAQTMVMLNKKLSYMNIRPYYQFIGDMVLGVEDLRTSVASAKWLEKSIRGSTSGFNMPSFVLDAPGGGGKRDIHSHEYYDEMTGLSIYRAPSVTGTKLHIYADPLRTLSPRAQQDWRSPYKRRQIINDALCSVNFN